MKSVYIYIYLFIFFEIFELHQCLVLPGYSVRVVTDATWSYIIENKLKQSNIIKYLIYNNKSGI